MKRITVHTLLLVVTLAGACRKEFLDLTPPSSIDAGSFYKNENDIRTAVTGAYASLHSEGQYRTANWQVGEVRSDNSYNWEGGGNFPDAELDQFKESTANSILNSMWLDTYHGILLCNTVLDRIGSISMTEALKKQYTGEMQFLRALMYFNLVRTFGDIPLVISPVNSVAEGYQQHRNRVPDIYAQIIADLNAASANLPVSYTASEVGRATSGAVQSLLGKVFLTTGDFSSAAAVLKQVIDAGNYDLLSSYAELWRHANANSRESIFEVQYKKGGQGTGSPYTNFFAPIGSGLFVTVVGTPYGRNLPTSDMIAAYEPGDRRKNASVALSYQQNGQTVNDPFTVKYRDVPYIEGDANDNWYVLRYADVLLMYAEALNELNNGPVPDATNAVDKVRLRAGLTSITDTLDKVEFARIIAHERQVELAFEGHRWFDLLRTGRALEVMNAHFRGAIVVQPFQLLFPIPQSQVNINPGVIDQNPGY